MSFPFFIKCFLIGISAASAVGPIFVLTCNNSALHGFNRGFFTALGASLGDGILLFLGCSGALAIINQSQGINAIIDFVGGVLLIIFGVFMTMHAYQSPINTTHRKESLIVTMIKTFLSTTINPLTLFFFTFISKQLLSTSPVLGLTKIMVGSFFTTIGSLLLLSTIAYATSAIGKTINTKYLKLFGFISSSIMIIVGIFFLYNAAVILFSLLA